MYKCTNSCRYLMNMNLCARASSGSFIVVPKITDDRPNNNPFLCYDQLPSFTGIKSHKVYTAINKACFVSEIYLDNIYKKFGDVKTAQQYISLIEELELIGVPLDYVLSNAHLCTLLKPDQEISVYFYKAYKNWNYLIKSIKRSQSLNAYFKKGGEFEESLNPAISALTRKMVDFYHRNGAEIPDDNKKQDFFLYSDELETSVRKYCNFIKDNLDNVNISASDPTMLKNLPNYLGVYYFGKNFDVNTRVRIRLETNLVDHVLQYCSPRNFRWNLWQAYLMIGVTGGGHYHSSNAITIGTVRHQCYRMASLMGYENAADMSLKGTVVGSVKAAEDFLYNIRDKLSSRIIGQLETLQEFSQKNGFRFVMEEYDVPYWRRLYEEKSCGLNYDQLASFFPFENVIDGLFGLFEDTFGVKFTERTDVSPWHVNVRCFDIIRAETDQTIGTFYLDPFRHEMKKSSTNSLCYQIRGGSEVMNVKPVFYISLNLCPDPKTGDTVVPFDFLEDACFQFSTMFYNVLKARKYHGIAGVGNNIPDLETFVPQFLTNFCLIPKNLIRLGTLPDVTSAKRIVDAKKFLKSLDFLWMTYFGMLDLELHKSTKHWELVQKSIWDEFLPFGRQKDDFRILNRPDLITSTRPGTGYAQLWTEVMAASAIREYQVNESKDFVVRVANISEISDLSDNIKNPDLDLFADNLF